jgi:hypothetical protein
MNRFGGFKHCPYICKTNDKQIEIMKGVIKIGKVTQDQILTVYKKASREMELENATGWVAKHKVHKSAKDYSRNAKHKNLTF